MQFRLLNIWLRRVWFRSLFFWLVFLSLAFPLYWALTFNQPIMNSTFTKIIRFLLAFILIAIGLNKFLNFIPVPELPYEASEFMGSLKATGYILTVLGIFEIIIGLLLLLNKWVAFAVLALVPISVNVLLYHLFLDIPSIGIAALVAVINFVLIYKLWPKYKPLFH